jgi:hypothetical protein
MPHEEIGFAWSRCKLPQTLGLALSGERLGLAERGIAPDRWIQRWKVLGTTMVQKPLKTVIHPCSHDSLGTKVSANLRSLIPEARTPSVGQK